MYFKKNIKSLKKKTCYYLDVMAQARDLSRDPESIQWQLILLTSS